MYDTEVIIQRLYHRLRAKLQLQRLFPCLTSGMLMGITEVIFALSVGSLMFAGELAPYLSYGIGIGLVTVTVMLIGISLGSSVPGVTGSLQDSSSVILAVIAATLAGTLSTAGAEDRLTTVLVTTAVTTLLTGGFFLALGFFKLGGLVRFLPYPVVGGFLAGTGWLLVRGGLSVTVDFPLNHLEFLGLAPTRSIALVGAGGPGCPGFVLLPAAHRPLFGDAGYSDRHHRPVLPGALGDGHVCY